MAPKIGYRFHPTDEELVNHYLRLKMLGDDHDHSVSEIPVVNICSFEPWELPALSVQQNINESKDLVWLFFGPGNSNSRRVNRKTNAGYWKITGHVRIVRSRETNKEIATKRTLVFYESPFSKGMRTNWVMHEYRPSFSFSKQRDFVLYKLKKRDDVAPAATFSTDIATFSTDVATFSTDIVVLVENATEINSGSDVLEELEALQINSGSDVLEELEALQINSGSDVLEELEAFF